MGLLGGGHTLLLLCFCLFLAGKRRLLLSAMAILFLCMPSSISTTYSKPICRHNVTPYALPSLTFDHVLLAFQ